jgi:hypothetical protein
MHASAFVLAAPLPARATEWGSPLRITVNGVEDRTTSGSLFEFWSEASLVWMQEQAGPGWRLMWSDVDYLGATPPAPVETGEYPDFAPRLSGSWPEASPLARHLVFQRGTGPNAEIMYATGAFGSSWTVEPITANATEDVTPDIADMLQGDGREHVVWAGFDPLTQSGKIFYARRSDPSWQVERLDGSQLGPFWTGAEPRVAVDYNDVVHVVYRGGNSGDYHVHYARKAGGTWTYQILNSGNGNDFTTDVAANGFDPVVAMSGNDGFGFPSRIYVRRSTDGGLSFLAPQLASGGFSMVLDNLIAGFCCGAMVIGSETSGNIYTEIAIISREDEGWMPEILPPMNHATRGPCLGHEHGADGPWPLTAAYTNHRSGGPDSAEVYFNVTPGGMGIGDGVGAQAGNHILHVHVAPNPFDTATWIRAESESPGPTDGAIYGAIYDVLGRTVRAFAGARLLRWDGTDAAGRRVPAGTYYLRIKVGDRSATRSLILVR